jgi:hypothetical protein
VRGQCPAGGSPTEDLGPCTPQVNGPSEWTRPAQGLASGRPTCPQSNVFGTSDRDFDGHVRLSVGCGSATGVRDQRPAMATPPGLRHIGGCRRPSVRRRSSVVRLRPTRQGRAEHRCGRDRVFLWPIRGVPSAIHSAASSTALAPPALAASRRATGGLLKLAYDVCCQSASITDVQAVRTCPVLDGFPMRERAASTGSPARTGTTWCATTPRGSTLRSTGAAAGSLPRPASGPLRPVALSRCQQRAERLPQLS